MKSVDKIEDYVKPLAIMASIALLYVYVHYTGNQYQNHISEIVSPLLHPESNLSILEKVGKDDYLAIYKVNDNLDLYVDDNNSYYSSKILNLIEYKTFSENHSRHTQYYDTRMLVLDMESHYRCNDHLKSYSEMLGNSLSSIKWNLNFEVKKNTTFPQITSILHTSFFKYPVPRLFLFCDKNSFVLISAYGSDGYSTSKMRF